MDCSKSIWGGKPSPLPLPHYVVSSSEFRVSSFQPKPKTRNPKRLQRREEIRIFPLERDWDQSHGLEALRASSAIL
jgi:hypothetical protein